MPVFKVVYCNGETRYYFYTPGFPGIQNNYHLASPQRGKHFQKGTNIYKMIDESNIQFFG
jgi:hypothetical protein